MKIALYSDLHTEFLERRNWLIEVPSETEVIVLAGDIGVGKQAISWVQKLADNNKDKQIVYVAGNHEFYHARFNSTLDRLRNAFKSNDQIYFLENESATIGRVRFLGCTLWTNFDACGKRASRIAVRSAKKSVADFELISVSERNWMTASFMSTLNANSSYWLGCELSKSFDGSTVVVTHFPPLKSCTHGLIADNELTPYFLNDMDALIRKHSPSIWCFGHNHCSCDFSRHGCRIISNQLGCPMENEIEIGFRRDLIIEL